MTHLCVRLAVLFALAPFGGAAEWVVNYRANLRIPVQIGSPPQGPFDFTFSPTISGGKNSQIRLQRTVGKTQKNTFDLTKSSTFKITGSHGLDIDGTDVFSLSSAFTRPTAIQQIPNVTVHLAHEEVRHPQLRFGRGNGSFLDSLFDGLGGPKSLVMLIQDSYRDEHYGTLIFGDEAPPACKRWNNFPATETPKTQMAFTATEVLIGNNSIATNVPIHIKTKDLLLGKELYRSVIRQFKVYEADGIPVIRCNEERDIVLRVGSAEYRVGPKVYKTTFTERRREPECRFHVFPSNDLEIGLPLEVFDSHCVRYDFDKNEVGIAELRSR